MSNAIERALEAALTGESCYIGEIVICRAAEAGYILTHRDDEERRDLETFHASHDAIGIAKFNEAGKYRSLKTAPNLRRGWRLQIASLDELRRALDFFYPGRLAMFARQKRGQLGITPLRGTLNRQSGMYRVAAQISDEKLNETVGTFCRSKGGCLRTILWKRDDSGAPASTRLPLEKYDPSYDQARALNCGSTAASEVIPLLCQEACNLLVAECRRIVKSGTPIDE